MIKSLSSSINRTSRRPASLLRVFPQPRFPSFSLLPSSFPHVLSPFLFHSPPSRLFLPPFSFLPFSPLLNDLTSLPPPPRVPLFHPLHLRSGDGDPNPCGGAVMLDGGDRAARRGLPFSSSPLRPTPPPFRPPPFKNTAVGGLAVGSSIPRDCSASRGGGGAAACGERFEGPLRCGSLCCKAERDEYIVRGRADVGALECEASMLNPVLSGVLLSFTFSPSPPPPPPPPPPPRLAGSGQRRAGRSCRTPSLQRPRASCTATGGEAPGTVALAAGGLRSGS